MTIQIGDSIPMAVLNHFQEGVQALGTDELFSNSKVLLFAVPGAFTPTCSARHLPGYVENMDKFRQRDIKVACLAVNDAFVMHAWGKITLFMCAGAIYTATKKTARDPR